VQLIHNTQIIKPQILHIAIFVAFGFTLILLNPFKVLAGTCTWTGVVSLNWSDGANWDGTCVGIAGVPGDGDTLHFPAEVTNKFMVNDIAGLDIVSLIFEPPVGPPPGVGYSIEGNPITLSDSIVAGASAYVNLLVDITFTDDVVFSSDRAITTHLSNLNLNGHQLNLDSNDFIGMRGSISGNGDVVISGDGTGWVDLDGNNTFIGDIIIETNAVVNFHENNAAGNINNPIYSTGPNATISIPVDNVTLPNDINLFADANLTSTGVNAEFSGEIEFANSLLVTVDYIIFPSDPAPSLTLSGEIIGNGEITKAGEAELIISQDSPGFTGSISVDQGNIFVNGDLGNASVTLDGGVLGGVGTLGSKLAGNGTIDPGAAANSIGKLNFVGDVALSDQETLRLRANSKTSYDRIEVAGDLDIADAVLDMSLGYTALPGDTLQILSATGTISGTFDGIVNGAIIIVSGRPFVVQYQTNIVQLTVPSVGLFHTSFAASPTSPNAYRPFIVTSTWSATGSVPTGTAKLFNGSTLLGTATLTVGSNASIGVAKFNVAGLPAGTYSLIVKYLGDINFSSRTSDPLIVTVVPITYQSQAPAVDDTEGKPDPYPVVEEGPAGEIPPSSQPDIPVEETRNTSSLPGNLIFFSFFFILVILTSRFFFVLSPSGRGFKLLTFFLN
jgi:hypothetical protein